MDIPEKNKVPVDLIAKFLNGDADTNDIIDLEQWKSASGENKKVFEEYRRIWEKTGQISIFADIDIENEWNIFLENLEEKYDSKTRERKISYAPVLKIAAALVIGLILGYAGWFSYRALRFEKVTAQNEVIEVDMPDGSLISLNRNSSISYLKKFNRKRELVLNGEAFFDVYADPANPFIIKSGEIRIEVVGTSFNVIAHKDESIVQVYVESGKVAVYDFKKGPIHKNLLEKGDRIIYSRKSGIQSVQPATDLNYKSWKTGVYRFENSSLQYITNLLEKNFQQNIELANPLLHECRINVSFQNESLEYMLETITETLDLQLVKTDKGYLIDGPEC